MTSIPTSDGRVEIGDCQTHKDVTHELSWRICALEASVVDHASRISSLERAIDRVAQSIPRLLESSLLSTRRLRELEVTVARSIGQMRVIVAVLAIALTAIAGAALRMIIP